MDKRLILSVAGSRKTTHIIKNLDKNKNYFIVTYTNNNYYNIYQRVQNKFSGQIPNNIHIYTFYKFLYNFCILPIIGDQDFKIYGINFNNPKSHIFKKNDLRFYLDQNYAIYSCRMSCFLLNDKLFSLLKERIKKFIDCLIIDEIQDIGGRDFTFIERIIKEVSLNMILVGDFFQHTYTTSHDGTCEKKLFKNYDDYVDRFRKAGCYVDKKTLSKSWRCPNTICDFIKSNLKIDIESKYPISDSTIIELKDPQKIKEIISDDNIIKLVYNNASKKNFYSKNWGNTKGEDQYQNICILLNKNTYNLFPLRLSELKEQTKYRLYVAMTRARKNLFFIEEKKVDNIIK